MKKVIELEEAELFIIQELLEDLSNKLDNKDEKINKLLKKLESE